MRLILATEQSLDRIEERGFSSPIETAYCHERAFERQTGTDYSV